MSHLIKKNKIISKTFKNLGILIISFSLIYTIINYEGSLLILTIYGLLINLILLNCLKKNFTFFEFFFGLFLWLGFWLKFCFLNYLDKERLSEGILLEGSDRVNILDNALIVSIVAFIGFLLASFTKDFFFKKININNTKNKSFIKKQDIYFVIILLTLVIVVAYFNLEYKIYQRGILSQSDLNPVISGVVKWLLLFGFASIFSFFLYYNLNNKKKLIIIWIFSILESAISSISFLSRGSIFNQTSVFLGLYKSNKFFKLNISPKTFFSLLFFIILFFFITVSTVNFLRPLLFNYDAAIKKETLNYKIENFSLSVYEEGANIYHEYNNLDKMIREFFSLAVNRWVGIDAVVSVEAKENRNFDYFLSSANEKFNSNKSPFYEREILRKNPDANKITYGIFTPGLVAFLNYSNNLIFIFFIIYLLTIFFLYLENILLKLTNNLIFCSLIFQIIAYRLAHFGYLPKQSYLLFGSILITVIIYLIAKKIIND